MNESERIKLPTQEQEPKLIGRVTVFRHGKTTYSEVFPDLTEEGKAGAQKLGGELATKLRDDEEVYFVSSPAARARGTMHIAKEVMGKGEDDVRLLKSMRHMDFVDFDAARAIFESIQAEQDTGIHAVDYAYTHDARFEERTDIYEPRSSVEGRFYRNLEYAIRAFHILAKDDKRKRPHFVVASHFEVLNHFVRDVFGLKHPEDPTIKHTEPVEIEVYETPGAPAVTLRVTFRGQTQTIAFDRATRKLV